MASVSRRHARLLRPLLALVAAVAVGWAGPAFAADKPVIQISEDPFTNATSQHQTEVEPDTFAADGTVVSTFQVGRFFNGGASDIGFATSHNGGEHWDHGFLPGVTTFSTPAGPYGRASDASVAFDARDHVWLISYLGINETPSGGVGTVDVVVSRSSDGLNWDLPVPVAKINQFLDKNWTVCDNSPRSPFFGNCYTEFDNASQRDLELMSTSTDGGLTWGPAMPTADAAHGLAGQPLVQPDGRVVVPFSALGGTMRSFVSTDGGASWSATAVISRTIAHRVAGGIRAPSLPSAEIDAAGRVYVVWQSSRFEANGAANDIVLSTSDDGLTWSDVRRIPIDAVGSNVDHFTPGLGVDSDSAGDGAMLALAYYFYPAANCTAAACQLDVGFVNSTDGGAHWSAPEQLAGPMQLNWLAVTNQGVMVADYISTSFRPGHKAFPVFAAASAPAGPSSFRQAMFTTRQEIRGGDVPMMNDPVLFTGVAGGGGGDDEGDDDIGI
jgi:BNR repeat-like domain